MAVNSDPDYELNDKSLLIAPVVGDTEVRGLRFLFPDLHIDIVEPKFNKKISIILLSMRYFHFESDHPQNVIERIHIYDKWENVRSVPGLQIDKLKPTSGALRCKFVVVECIVGGPLICGAHDLKISVVN